MKSQQKQLIEGNFDLAEFEEIENTILCAKWLIHRFEELQLTTIARLFQRALDDSEAWINTMADTDAWPQEYAEPIAAREAQAIHSMLVKYASINNTDIREEVLREMQRITNKQQN